MARPRKTLPANALPIIREAAANGVKEIDLAKALGLDYRTWIRIRDESEEAREAYREAKQIEKDTLVGVLFEKALAGDLTAAIYLLKCRHGMLEVGGRDNSDRPRVNITFNVPGPLNAEDYSKLVQQVAPAAIAHAADEDAA